MRIKFSAALLSVVTIFSVATSAQAQENIFSIREGQDPRGMCDMGYGTDEQSSAVALDNSIKRSDSFHSEDSSEHESFISTSSEGSAKVKVFGIGGGGSGKKTRTAKEHIAENAMLKTDAAYQENRIFSHEQSSSTTVTFENADCSHFVKAAATVRVAEIEADVNHAAIEAKQQQSYFDMLMQEEW